MYILAFHFFFFLIFFFFFLIFTYDKGGTKKAPEKREASSCYGVMWTRSRMNGRVDGWKDKDGNGMIGWQHCERSIYIGAHIGVEY